MGYNKSRNICVLTDIHYSIEFTSEPSDEIIQALASGLKKDEDRLQWDIAGEKWADGFFNPESTHRLNVFLDVRPCSQSSGVEGDFDDIDDATPDNEIPQELISRLRDARELAKKCGGYITDGTCGSEYTPRPTTWREHEEELKEMERARERRALAQATGMALSEVEAKAWIEHMNSGAPGGPGRSELNIVGSLSGHSIHLWDKKERDALCGGLKNTGQIVLPQVTFGVLGCMRCAREAVKRGYTYIHDIDGAKVELQAFRPSV
jgi:hypothetical protein